jgi:hypothetical protein
MLLRVELRQLRYFVAVAETGNISDRLAGALFEIGAPINVFDTQAIRDLSGSVNAFALQPEGEPFPGVFVPLQSLCAFAMPGEELRNPSVGAVLTVG